MDPIQFIRCDAERSGVFCAHHQGHKGNHYGSEVNGLIINWPQRTSSDKDFTTAAATRTFATISAERKAAPLYAGCVAYFPDALLAVARLSKKANDKHNPGEPLHWSKEKSNDHADCLLRHQLNPEEMDEEMQEIHAVMVAWRALAQLQTIIGNRKTKSR